MSGASNPVGAAGPPDELPALPPGWWEPERFSEWASIGRWSIALVGLSSTDREGVEALGSAADPDGPPEQRAYFELLERIAVLDAARRREAVWTRLDVDGKPLGVQPTETLFPNSPLPNRWRYARSNGVAAHHSWHAACSAAARELAERDRVLRAWLGDVAPFELALPTDWPHEDLERHYELRLFVFGEPEPSGVAGELVYVAGLFGFPRSAGAPLVYGFGADCGEAAATGAAARECLQRLGFLWGQEIPGSVPESAPTPAYHQEYYLCPSKHECLRRWLSGAHRHASRALPLGRKGPEAFVSLTPKELSGRLHIVKAVSGCMLPLAFGDVPADIWAPLPPPTGVHPIA